MKPWGWIAIVGLVVALLTLGGIGLGRVVLAEKRAPALVSPIPGASVAPRTLDGNGVSIRVTPLELRSGATSATFDVALNTHSVDLSYDLAELATLRLDTGTELTAPGWSGTLGGHHVSGQLTFPAVDLEGVRTVELVVRDVAGIPVWTFTWDLP